MTKRTGNPTDFESFLTWEALTEVLSYDAESGEFRWLKSARPGWVGRVAGHVNPATGYREIRLSKRVFLAHRLAFLWLTQQWPNGVVDHINGGRTDNRWSNLRDVPPAANAINRGVNRTSNTGVVGVHYDTSLHRYVARLSIGGERKYLGCFVTLEQAAAARRAAETEHYGTLSRADCSLTPLKQARVKLPPQSSGTRGRVSDVNSGLTQAMLTRIVSYDPATGEFRWLETVAGEVKVGPIAGKTNKKGYRVIGIGGRAFYGHRLAWLYVTGEWPAALVDHVDGNPSNNAWANLRAATSAQNNANRAQTASKSGVTGVYWHAERGKWTARASVNNKLIYLGIFETIEEAAAAREAFETAERDGFFTRKFPCPDATEVSSASAEVIARKG